MGVLGGAAERFAGEDRENWAGALAGPGRRAERCTIGCDPAVVIRHHLVEPRGRAVGALHVRPNPAVDEGDQGVQALVQRRHHASEYTTCMSRPLPKIVVLTGPTGVGKTALAVELVARFGGEVVSADSRQVYKYLDIGTARPDLDELRRARHHLIDYVDPAEPYSVTRYREDADAVLEDLAAREQTAWVVGGSWHYIQALVDRIEPPQVPPNPELRA